MLYNHISYVSQVVTCSNWLCKMNNYAILISIFGMVFARLVNSKSIGAMVLLAGIAKVV